MLVLFGGVGGGAWFGANKFFGKDNKPAPVLKTAEKAGGKLTAGTTEPSVESTVALDSFKSSIEGKDGQTFLIELNGKQAKNIYGQVQGGKQTLYLTTNTGNLWPLDLPNISGASPFGDNMILKSEFSLSSTEHDFTGDGVQEIVLAARDKSAETYIGFLL